MIQNPKSKSLYESTQQVDTWNEPLQPLNPNQEQQNERPVDCSYGEHLHEHYSEGEDGLAADEERGGDADTDSDESKSCCSRYMYFFIQLALIQLITLAVVLAAVFCCKKDDQSAEGQLQAEAEKECLAKGRPFGIVEGKSLSDHLENIQKRIKKDNLFLNFPKSEDKSKVKSFWSSNQKELLDQFCSIEEGNPKLKKREEELDEKEKELNIKAKGSADKLQELKKEHDQTKEKLEKQEEEHDQTKEKLEKQEEVNRKLVVKKDEITEDLLEATKKLTETNKDLQETKYKLVKAKEKIDELNMMQAEEPNDQGEQPQQSNRIEILNILLPQIKLQKYAFWEALTDIQKDDPRIENLFNYQTQLIEQLQKMASHQEVQEELKEKIKNIQQQQHILSLMFDYQTEHEMLTSEFVKGGQDKFGQDKIIQQIGKIDHLVKQLDQAFALLTRNW